MSQKQQQQGEASGAYAPYPPMMQQQQGGGAAVPSKSALSPSPQYSTTGYLSSAVGSMTLSGLRGATGGGGGDMMSPSSRIGLPASSPERSRSDQATALAADKTRPAQTLPSLIRMLPSSSYANALACINCAEPPSSEKKDESVAYQHQQRATTSAAAAAKTPPRNNRKLGPLLLELRQLQLSQDSTSTRGDYGGNGDNKEDNDDDVDVFFTTRRIAVSRGNPSLGSSVASTCLDLPVVQSYNGGGSSSPNPVGAAATGLSTGMLCIHTFRDHSSSENDNNDIDGGGGGGEENLQLSSSIEYYHTPRHHRQASAVAWRPTNHNHVAIGLLGSNTSAGGHHHHHHHQHPQASISRRGTANMSSSRGGSGGDREFCCIIFDIESQSSANAKRNSTPISKLSHNAPVASLAWMMDGQTLAVGLQSRTVQLYDMRAPGSNVPPISAYAHNFGVHGIEVDPHRPHVMATFSRSPGEAVKIWDCRRMDSVFSEIKIGGSSTPQSQASRVVEAVKWATLDPGVLSVAIGDSVQDYDTNSSSSRPVLTRVNYSKNSRSIRDMALFGGASTKKSTSGDDYVSLNDSKSDSASTISNKLIEALYPCRVLTVLDDRSVCDMAKHTISPVEISRRDGRLVHALGSIICVSSTISGPSAMERSTITSDDDISATMMRRARCSRAARYSMETGANIKLLSEEVQKLGETSLHSTSDVISTRLSLLRLWSWIERVESLSSDAEDMEDDPLRWPAKGLLDSGIWHLLGLSGESSGASSVEYREAYSELLSCPIYDSVARRHALTSCGWVGNFDLPNILGECESLGEYERSAALAVWHGDVGAAVDSLQRASDTIRRKGDVTAISGNGDEKSLSYAETLDLVAMCLAGFGANSSSSTVWENACTSLLRRDDLSESQATKTSAKAYLRGLCQFLLNVGQNDFADHVLHNSKLSLSDRVAFACRFLGPKDLREYLLQSIESCKATGNVEGLVLTGLSKDGIRIMQSFVDRYADVQSAAFVVSRTVLPAEWGVERKICLEWVEAYRGLLNTWQMWQSRAMFDVDRADHLRRIKAKGVDGAIPAGTKGNFPGSRRPQMPLNRRSVSRMLDPDVVASIPAQLDVRCNYCSSPLGLRRNEGGTNQWLSKMKSVLSCCPQCRKPLPRCAICLLSMGCLNPYMELTRERSRSAGLLRGGSLMPPQDDMAQVSSLPFAEWFTWCMKCKHGGHAHHLVGWFANHEGCPVSGCNCKCQFDGIQKLSRPAQP